MPKQIFSAGIAISTALAIALGLSACTAETSGASAPGSSTSSTPEATASSFPEETVLGYFTPISATAPADKAAAIDFAAPNSVAAMYVTEQVAHSQAQQDGGTLIPGDSDVLIEDETVFLCDDGHESEGADKSDYCVEFSEFVFDENNKIVSFNAGVEPLEGRISIGDGSTVPITDIGTVTYLSSYVTIMGELVVVVEVSSSVDPLTIAAFDATYITDDGRPTLATYFDGPYELKSDRLANVALIFPNVGLGGTLELDFHDPNFNNYTVEIPTLN